MLSSSVIPSAEICLVVDTVVELAHRNPENLYNKLVEVNEAEHVVESMPSDEEVADWVAQAKELPRVITY